MTQQARPKGWLAFELNVLRRLKFGAAALPSGGEILLGANLKHWNVRVLTNDLLQSDRTNAVAAIENHRTILSPKEISVILEDVYVPHYQRQNVCLQNRFGETDAWWFENIWQNIEKLSSATARAVAAKIAMNVGDYALSFDDETRELQQPLSNIFKMLAAIEPKPFDNNQKNVCAAKPLNNFVAENHTDLMFLRLPVPRRADLKTALGQNAWREEWIRGNADFWNDLEVSQTGALGGRVESKTQYLDFVENVLKTASHIPQWAIAFVEEGFVQTPEVVETINRVRRVETVFTKDFSELTGAKAVIITA